MSPLCSSKLYIYRGVKNNILMIDESQLDNIIRNECGKQELKKLKDCSMKRKFISGLLKKTQISLYDDWMNNTGYNMFIDNMNSIMNKYSNIIYSHINNDIIKLHVIDSSKDMKYFDTIYKNVKEINSRIEKAKKYSNEKIPDYLLNNLDIINKKINKYLIDGSESYTGSTIDIVNLFLQRIELYYFNIKNLFVSNPILTSKKVLEEKRIDLLCNKMLENFDYDIFVELLEKNKLTDEIFICSIKNTFIKSCKNFKNIISVLEKYDEKYLNIAIDGYIEFGVNEKLSTICFQIYLEILLNYKSSNLYLIYKVINKFLGIICCDHYKTILYIDFWIKLNYNEIKCSCNEIQIIFMKLNIFINYHIIKFDVFVIDDNSDFVEIEKYNQIKDFMDCTFNILRETYNIEKNHEFTKNTKILQSNIEYLQCINATENSTEITKEITKEIDSDCSDFENKYEVYSDSDNSDIVYKKAISNSSKRTKKIIKKGSK
jgi:hypothetical protein